MSEQKVIQGDCLVEMAKMPSESFDLICTDPPYNTGMTASSSSTRLKNFFNDSYTDEEYLKLVRGGATQMFRLLKNDRACYVFINWKKLGIWIDELTRAGFKVKNTIVWDKVVHGLNYQNYAYTHEFIIFAVKGHFLPKHKERGSEHWKDIWHISRTTDTNADSAHETVKTLEVLYPIIKHATEPNWAVLDPFGGTGSTAVACKNSEVNSTIIEISPEYCEIARRRLEQDLLF